MARLSSVETRVAPQNVHLTMGEDLIFSCDCENLVIVVDFHPLSKMKLRRVNIVSNLGTHDVNDREGIHSIPTLRL